MKKLNIWMMIIIVVLLILLGFCVYKFNFVKQNLLTDNGSLIKDDLPKMEPAVLTEPEARVIAERSCIKGGGALEAGIHNISTKTWWFDANLNATREGCNPACVVGEVTKTAEINWRCTGLITPTPTKPVACTMDAKQCPDGSYVGRSGPNCEFVCPKISK
jgi:hypothetical protein